MRIGAIAVALASVWCLPSCNPFTAGAFSCTENSQCDLEGGVCEDNGLCSFADGSCPSGRRYGERSGDLSGVCVGEEPGPDGGGGDDGGEGCVAWPQPATHFDNCAVGTPPGTPLPAPTFEAGLNTLDTDSGTLTTPGGSSTLTFDTIAQTGGPEIALFFFESFDLPDGATLRLTGDRVALLASDSTMTIAGEIDLTSSRGQANEAAGVGFTDHCLGAVDSDGNSGGGGGGSLGSGGGAGGSGNSMAGSGGDAGQAVTLGDLILPGCPGGTGQDRNGTNMSDGGLGGGAVQLAARASIALSSTALVAAGGMGGNAVNANASGGGGGGSGGFIGLDSQSVMVDPAALLLFQGGGGGEGSGSSNVGDPGDDAPKADAIAVGGQGGSGSGGDGGNGGFNGQTGAAGGNSTNGGGGGGGGLGVCNGCP